MNHSALGRSGMRPDGLFSLAIIRSKPKTRAFWNGRATEAAIDLASLRGSILRRHLRDTERRWFHGPTLNWLPSRVVRAQDVDRRIDRVSKQGQAGRGNA